MAKEIEHRWLLSTAPNKGWMERHAISFAETENGYLGNVEGNTIQERFSRIFYLKHRELAVPYEKFSRTVKIGHGIERLEFIDKIDKLFFFRVWPLTAGNRIYKRRYKFERDGLTWELDTYSDRNKCMVEVEVPSKNAIFKIPQFINKLIVKEVTYDSNYEGIRLAQ